MSDIDVHSIGLTIDKVQWWPLSHRPVGHCTG